MEDVESKNFEQTLFLKRYPELSISQEKFHIAEKCRLFLEEICDLYVMMISKIENFSSV